MIYVDEKYLTIAGKKIPGQVQSVTITEEGKIEDKKNSKGKVTKTNQPTGFEAAKVEVSMYFEEDGSYTAKEQIQYIQRLFKTTKQKKQKKYRIVETQCAARGITEVYFNGFTTTEDVNQSWFTGTLSFVAPLIVNVSVVKTKAQKAREKAAAQKKAAAAKKAAAKKKTTKKTSKSPAKDTKNKTTAKKAAKKVVKKTTKKKTTKKK